jgi:predicted permease
MEILSRIRSFFNALFRRKKLESDMCNELQFHLEAYADDLMANRGLSREEALRQARIDFGSIDKCKETVRETRGLRIPDELLRNSRYAFRQFRRNPGFTIASVLTLALGIGVNTAIFSVFYQMVLQPLPVPEPDRLVNLTAPGPKSGGMIVDATGGADDVFSYPMFRDLEKSQGVFTGIAAHCRFAANLAAKGTTQSGSGLFVSGSYFPVLGVRAELGRLLGPLDDRTIGGSRVVVLSYGYWKSRFDRDPGVLNQTLVINGQPMTIVGVAQRGFSGTALLAKAQVFVPITLRGLMLPWFKGFDNRLDHWAYLFARLKPGISPEHGQKSMNVQYHAMINNIEAPLQIGFSKQTMALFKSKTLVLKPGMRGQVSFNSEDKKQVGLILGLTMLVWIIACSNVANLLLVRGVARRVEMSIRLSVGANRRRIVAQLLTESCLLSLFAGAASILLSQWTIHLLVLSLPPQVMDLLQFSLDKPVLLFAAALTLGTGLFFGLFPALHCTRSDLAASLKIQAGRQSSVKSTALFRTILCTTQIALSLALLVVAAYFAKSLFNLNRIDPGFKVDNIIVFGISPSMNGYSFMHAARLFEQLEDELSALPGVSGASNSQIPVLSGGVMGGQVAIEGRPVIPDADASFYFDRIGPGYFRTLGIPLLAGREFARSDTEGMPKVAIINKAFAEKFKLGQKAIGTRIGDPYGPLDIQIVGLVRNMKHTHVLAPEPPLLFRPYRQDGPMGSLTFYVNTSLKPASLMPGIKKLVSRLDPNLPIEDLATMRQRIQQSIWGDRSAGILTTALAVLSILLTLVGLHGVLAFAVTRRTQEIGLRIALGASRANVRFMIFRQGGIMILIGGGAGLAIAAGLVRLMRSFYIYFHQIEGLDPALFCGSGIVIALIALAACLIPAYRASKVDPMQALRYE